MIIFHEKYEKLTIHTNIKTKKKHYVTETVDRKSSQESLTPVDLDNEPIVMREFRPGLVDTHFSHPMPPLELPGRPSSFERTLSSVGAFRFFFCFGVSLSLR